ncbi:MAG: peptidoglycan-binding protein [Verrucomicrobia bacterium]|nr:peptidoglycan-binding protein [Verrucomicrobiota bacterium]
MKTFLCFCAIAVLAGTAWGDELTRAVQQRLKDQGFFYGDATGQPGSETDAAIRRYQIRYGLKVTGGLNDETMHSLGLKSGDFPPPQNAVRRGNETNAPPPASSPKAAPRPQAAPAQALPPKAAATPAARPRAAATPRPSPSSRRAAPTYRPHVPEETPDEEPQPNQPPGEHYRATPPETEPPGRNYGGENQYRPGGPNYGGLFAGGLYSRAPSRVKLHVLEAIQNELGHAGIYRGEVDGQPTSATLMAIARFQEVTGLPPTGRLDTQTLLALRVLPGQENGPPVRRVYRFGPYGPTAFPAPAPYGPYPPYGPYGGPYGPFVRTEAD